MTTNLHRIQPHFSAAGSSDDPRRARLLSELGIVDSEPESSFDGLTQAARLLTGCPIALVSLLDVNRQWFKSRQGLRATETPIESSFCSYAVQHTDLFEIEDAWADPRFAANPLVMGEPHVRFYAGQPLMLNGVMLGTLCVIDTRPNRLSPEVRQALEGLARAAEALIAARHAMVALEDQRQRLVDIACASGDWLWESDAQGRVIWSAAYDGDDGADGPLRIGHRLPQGALLDIWGCPLEPAVTLFDLLARQTAVADAIVCQATPNGAIHLSFSALPRIDAAGQVVGFRGTARNVSAWLVQERQRHDDDLNLRLERDAAQQVARLRNEVVSRVSHELRTPLNAVVGFAQLLLRDPQDVALYARHIHRAGSHLLALVNDMLNLARLETGNHEVQLQPVSTAGVMQRCLDLLKPDAHEKSVSLHALTEPDAEVVMADQRGLTQALLNLAGNALKFSPLGGAIEMRARRVSQDWVQIDVTDHGPGIAPESIPLLFLPSSQLPGTRKNNGTGLGLAISRQLVHAMGGEISVRSAVGAGATFSIALRAAEPGLQATADSAYAALEGLPLAPATTLLNVLYIEDDPVNALLLEHMLAHLSRVCLHHAATAAEGLQRAMALKLDLILLDMNLPDSHGLDLLKILRADARIAHVPVVALSADALPESISAARLAGFDDYLTKPVDMVKLERLVSCLR